MAFATIEPDISELQLSLALLLYDGFTGAQELIGDITVSVLDETLSSPIQAPSSPLTGQAARQWMFRKIPDAIFLFFGLPPGAYTLEVRSNSASPDETREIPPARVTTRPAGSLPTSPNSAETSRRSCFLYPHSKLPETSGASTQTRCYREPLSVLLTCVHLPPRMWLLGR